MEKMMVLPCFDILHVKNYRDVSFASWFSV